MIPCSVIFDLDGTLVDTSTDVLDAFATAFSVNAVVKFKLDKYCIGPPAIEVVRKAAPDLDAQKHLDVLKSFRQLHDSSTFPHTVCMGSVLDILTVLRENGVNCFIATNKPRAGASKVLEKVRLTSYFTELVCLGDEGVTNKQAGIARLLERHEIDSTRCWLVSDNLEDISLGENLGIETVAYLSGFSQPDNLLQLAPSHSIKSMEELMGIIPHECLRKDTSTDNDSV